MNNNLIYGWFSKTDNRVFYIGRTKDLEGRTSAHKNTKQDTHAERMAREIGWDTIEVRMLQSDLSLENAIICETLWFYQLLPIWNGKRPPEYIKSDPSYKNYTERQIIKNQRRYEEYECLAAIKI